MADPRSLAVCLLLLCKASEAFLNGTDSDNVTVSMESEREGLHGNITSYLTGDEFYNEPSDGPSNTMSLAANGFTLDAPSMANMADNNMNSNKWSFFRFLNSLGIGRLEGEGCCRRSQKQDCRSVRERLTCFENIFNGRLETCCPIFPPFPVLYVADCACRCRRLSTSRTFWAICNRNYIIINIRRITRNLPTSCSCRRRNGRNG